MTDKNLLKRFEDAVVACNRCGFCTSYCPTYLATGSEVHSPRGRNQLFRALLEGKLSDSSQAVAAVDTCLLCGECTHVCFSEVPTADLMIQARGIIQEKLGTPRFLQFFLKFILPFPSRFSRLLKLAFIGKKMGFAWFLKKLGILKRISPPLDVASDLVDKVSLRFLRDSKLASPYLLMGYQDQQMILLKNEINKNKAIAREPINNNSPMGTVAYFPPCGSQYLKPAIGFSTLELFIRLKIKFVIPDVLCCGLPAASYGVLPEAKSIAQENIRRLENGKYDHIIIDDSSCGSHIKDYPKLFLNDAAWFSRAQAISIKVRELSSFLLNQGLPNELKWKTWQGGPIAYHDPCKAQYGQKSTQPPRELLSHIKGLRLIPIPESDQCCGGGGMYSFMQPDISRAVMASKIKNITSTGVSTVVTSSASCLIQLQFGLRKIESKITATHLSEFLVRVLDFQR